MADAFERELRALDAERPLPGELYTRLESALLADATERLDGGDTASLLASLDAPRPIPPATRTALERELTAVAPVRRDRRSLLLAAAAAVLVVVGSVAVLRADQSPSDRRLAAGRTMPSAGVPPVLQTPSTVGVQSPAAMAAPKAAAAAPPTTRRSTTTTTWNCGLCARNGYAAAAAAAAPPTTAGGTWQPSGAAAPAAMASTGPWISTVDPSSGSRRGGTVVTLRGGGFTGASGVVFGSMSAANFTVVSDTEIRVMAPSSPTAQRVTVAVTYPDGAKTPTSDSGPFFTYT